jgi:hypothetical protein
LIWTIWNCRNEVLFNRCANPNFLHVIHRVASPIHLWLYLLPVKQRVSLDVGLFWLYSTMVSGCTTDALRMPHRLFLACSLFR